MKNDLKASLAKWNDAKLIAEKVANSGAVDEANRRLAETEAAFISARERHKEALNYRNNTVLDVSGMVGKTLRYRVRVKGITRSGTMRVTGVNGEFFTGVSFDLYGKPRRLKVKIDGDYTIES